MALQVNVINAATEKRSMRRSQEWAASVAHPLHSETTLLPPQRGGLSLALRDDVAAVVELRPDRCGRVCLSVLKLGVERSSRARTH